MKYFLLLICLTFCHLLGCNLKYSESTQILIINNEFNILFKDFTIDDTTLNETIYFQFIQDPTLLSTVNKSKLIKIVFQSDSTFNVKTYTFMDKKYVIRGNLGKFESKRIMNKFNYESFLLDCYKKSWK